MKKFLKWTLGVVGALVVVAAVGAFIGWQMADSKMARKIDIKVAPVAFTSDAQANICSNRAAAWTATAPMAAGALSRRTERA
ncbi:MAG: hypothetical protein V4787_23085 [Pseudomonadota bacterium]